MASVIASEGGKSVFLVGDPGQLQAGTYRPSEACQLRIPQAQRQDAQARDPGPGRPGGAATLVLDGHAGLKWVKEFEATVIAIGDTGV
jgi:hypothetical protein